MPGAFDLCGHSSLEKGVVALSICSWLSHVPQMGTCQRSSPDVVPTIDFFFLLLTIAVISHSEARALSSPL